MFTRRAAPFVLALATGLVAPFAGGAASPVAATAATAVKPSGPVEQVLLTLTPQNRGALRSLAQSSGMSRPARLGALAAALPSAAQRRSVVSVARALGLTVEATSTLGVTVSGRASVVRALFGSARAVNRSGPTAQPLPALPTALRPYVTVALGGDDNRPAFRPAAVKAALPNALRDDATADGTDFRTAYGDTQTNPLQPSTDERNVTIATIQLTGWHPSDLTAYAAFMQKAEPHKGTWPKPHYAGVNDPLHYAKDVTDPSDFDFGADVEVDLDQESIYSAAPYAHQRAYLSNNTSSGFLDSLQHLGDDAIDPTADRHIVAASTSWGFCETDLNDPADKRYIKSVEDAFSYVLAGGVTFFASSGDEGGYCNNGETDEPVVAGVSYPASSPQVVGVGGTQYTSGKFSVTGTPTGWVDSGPIDANSSPSDGASGGGTSIFSNLDDSFQSGTSAPRKVPDISAVASAEWPGFDIETTSPSYFTKAPVRDTYGGTSLASPVSAATYAVQLAATNYEWGVGDILPGLYAQVAATPASVTDVTDGCAAANSSCPGWNGVDVAKPGYDEVTGLGTPVWSQLLSATTPLGGDPHLSVGHHGGTTTLTVPVTVRAPDWQSYPNGYRIDVASAEPKPTQRSCDTTKTTAAPTSVTLPEGSKDGRYYLTLTAVDAGDGCHFAEGYVVLDRVQPRATARLSAIKKTKSLSATWRASDTGSGVGAATATLKFGTHVVWSRTASSGTLHTKPIAGKRYTLSVTALDRAGNSRTVTAALLDDRALARHGRWTKDKARTAYDGTLLDTTHKGATAAGRITGRVYTIYVTTCSACGKLAVYVAGSKRLTFDTYSKRTHDRVAVHVWSATGDAVRRVTVKALGSKDKRSVGHRVLLDAIATQA